jgi:hypothetical protein
VHVEDDVAVVRDVAGALTRIATHRPQPLRDEFARHRDNLDR